ncbi:MAG: class I SAM-dependent methyltransferase [Methylobacter sp.]
MKISAGLAENGAVVGNNYDKYGSANLIVRWLMQGFESALTQLVDQVKPSTIHEVGCGEGYLTLKWREQGIAVHGSDFSNTVIELAQANALGRGLPAEIFHACSIYDLNPEIDAAQLVVCCEVLEHLEFPERGLQKLQALAKPYLIISVPREPLWSAMNIARGKYWRDFGNTPGHVQRWSQRQFVALVSDYFDVLEIKFPIPWTMLLCRYRES